MPQLPRSLRVVALVISFALLQASARDNTSAQSQTRPLYVSAIGKNNSPITDLGPDDFEVKADGRKADVVAVNRAAAPLKVAAIVSDLGTGVFQVSLGRFVEQLHHRAELAILRTALGPERLMNYSADLAVLMSAVRRLGPMGPQGGYGSQLMDTIDDVVREVHAKGTRRAIVVLRIGGEGRSGLSPDDVRARLRQSGAFLFVMSAPEADPPPFEYSLSLSQVLNDGARESGGRHEQVVSNTMIPALDRLATELLHQYVVDVSVPSDARPDAKVSVSTKRKGVVLRAPSRFSPTS